MKHFQFSRQKRNPTFPLKKKLKKFEMSRSGIFEFGRKLTMIGINIHSNYPHKRHDDINIVHRMTKTNHLFSNDFFLLQWFVNEKTCIEYIYILRITKTFSLLSLSN